MNSIPEFFKRSVEINPKKTAVKFKSKNIHMKILMKCHHP